MRATTTILPLLLAATGIATAASISLNFSENNGNQNWLTPATPVGPLGTSSDNFNTTNDPTGGSGSLPVRTGSLDFGSIAGLVDDSGTATAASVTWDSSNAWFSGSGTGSNEARLTVGYLDDGAFTGGATEGIQIDFSGIPYPAYNVHIILASDQNPDTYTSQDFLVNGNPVIGSDFTAFSNWGAASANGSWVEATASTTGNYITARNQSGATLNIDGPIRDGVRRASIAGVIVEEVPEPSTTLLGGLAGLVLLLRRRR